MIKRASIDIGSNSVLLLLVEIDEKTKLIKREILNESAVTSLGKDLDKNKSFLESSMEATFEALARYKDLLDKSNFKASSVIVTATEASRVATNAKVFFIRIKNELGFNVTTISSEGEAYYTALGVVSSLSGSDKEATIMDIGGASTELIKIKTSPFEIISSISLPVGSVRATDWKINGEFDQKMIPLLSHDLNPYLTAKLVCVAGSMTALATMYKGLRNFNAEAIEGMKIETSSFNEFSRDLQNTTVENLHILFDFIGKRAPFVAAGSKVAQMIAEKLNVKELIISTRGLRYGVVMVSEIDKKFIP